MDSYQDTGVGQKAQDAAGQVADQLSQKTSDLAQQAQQTAKSTLHQQKGQVAGSVDTVAQALRQTGKTLQDQDQAGIGQVVEQAAERLSQFSDDLQNKSVDEIFNDVQDFARRDPQLFLGGAFVLGLLAARFFKSSSRQGYMQQGRSSQYYRQGGAPGYYRSRPAGGYYSQQDLTDYRDEALNNEYTGNYRRSGYVRPAAGTGSEFEAGSTFATGEDTGFEDTERGYPTGSAAPESFDRRPANPLSRSNPGQEGAASDASDEWA